MMKHHAQLRGEHWFQRLPHRVQHLLEQTLFLIEREEGLETEEPLYDYGFLIFSAAKAYEGYLKEFFLDNQLINMQVYQDEHFRIGRALNPDMPNRYRNEDWLFDDVASLCGVELAHTLWNAWKDCRNQVFHYAFTAVGYITLEEAKNRVSIVIQAMQAAEACEVAHTRH